MCTTSPGIGEIALDIVPKACDVRAETPWKAFWKK
jgi:hypothetical protein